MTSAELLTLFAETEIFIFVFMEIITKVKTFQRVIIKKAAWRDTLIFVLIFGAFSIFGTYVGIKLPSGAISNIRDLGPMIVGLVAGPLAGLGAGLIGGVHRYFLGGFTSIPCGLATVLAGLIGGAVFRLTKGKLINVFQGMGLAVLIECVHGGLILLLARPFSEALVVVKTAIPAMMVANSLGMAISIIIINNSLEPRKNFSFPLIGEEDKGDRVNKR
jgi:sigma-B regulation protein RsbU (phosphoserine phosphatase)